jgi:ADP-ribosylglycohydrolase
MPYDPLDVGEQLRDEITQRVQSGYLPATSHVWDLDDAVSAPPDPEAWWSRIEGMPRAEHWSYDEPDSWDDIVSTLGPSRPSASLPRDELADRIGGAWLGRIAGCNVGKPVEDGAHWSRDHVRSYLERAGAYPLRGYIPVLRPMPSEYQLREDTWRETTLGNVRGSARDDDIDYSILSLHLLEKHGRAFTRADVARTWLELLPYEQVFTAERVTYRNLVAGCSADLAGGFRNPYREWIGALIRGDVFGYVHPGDPRAAALLSYEDAILSHRGNGIYGEMWAAALVAEAFTSRSIHDVVTSSIHHIPQRSRLHGAISRVVTMYDTGAGWDQVVEDIEHRWEGYSWVHVVNNAATVAAALLFSEEDPSAAIGLAVMAGLDTDSSAATAGSVMGAYVGAARMPDALVSPLRDRVRSALFGFDGSRISDLARRTLALVADEARSPHPGSGGADS